MSGGRNSEYFMDHPEEFDALSPAEQNTLLTEGVLEGDTKVVETEGKTEELTKTEETAAAPEAEADANVAGKTDVVVQGKEVQAEPEAEPVITSKDGKHVIPYSELLAARDEARNWQQKATDATALLAQLEEAKQTDKAAGDTAAQDEVLKNLQEQFPELAEELLPAIRGLVKAGVDASVKELEAKIEGIVKPLQASVQVSAAQSHYQAIEEAHPQFGTLVESKEFTDWVDKQPSFMKTEFNRVLDKGTAPEVIELFTAFKSANPAKTTVTETVSAEQIKDNAKKVLEQVKTPVPNSLSDVPAGGKNHHDEGEAMHEKNPLQLMNMFEGKSPAQIEALINKAM